MSDAHGTRTWRSITARPTLAEKRRFALLAEARGITEGQLALRAIRALLDQEAAPGEPRDETSRGPKIDRLTVRLRPGDRALLRRRAADRGMRDSTYLAALVRAHLGAVPPLPPAEFAELRHAVTLFANHRDLLADMVRTPRWRAIETLTLLRELQIGTDAARQVSRDLKTYLRAALKSWESPLER